MFQDGNDGDVMLGIPSTEKYSDSQNMKNRSKLGGIPIWHSNPSLLSCPLCRKCSKEMLFVGQVYAPTMIDRSLYIFCCPSICASQSDGWYIIRNQGNSREVIETPVAPLKAIPATNWGNICDTGQDDEDLSDLMDLLNARDNSLSKKCLGSDNTPPPIPSLKDHVDSPASAESGVFRSMFGPIWLNEEYESSFLDGHQNRLDHEEELFRKYLEEKTKETSPDEDTAVLALLRSQQMSKNHDINDEEESESDEEELRTMMSTRSHITKSRSDHIKGDSASIRKQRKIEMLFQNKMLICPQQVLRYAYGGIPLSTSHNESQIYPPKCSGCNESRVFEMQLMPTILEFLVDVIPKKKSNECDTKNDNLTIDDYEEIYFGVVTIWSCPNSCQQSYEEVAIVQSPLDE